MSSNRGDVLGGGLIPRKGEGQASVQPPEIHLPKGGKLAKAGQGGAPKPANQAARKPASRVIVAGGDPSRTLAMSFRLSEDDLLRLKTLALRTGRSQQQVLFDALQRELEEHGY